MATIYKEILIEATPERVWTALRDFGAVDKRLAPGFVTDCRIDGDARVVTFANGSTAREVFIGSDEKNRRIAYSVVGSRASHHNASAQALPAEGNRTRFVWITDVLPNEISGYIDSMMEQGVAVMKRTLEIS